MGAYADIALELGAINVTPDNLIKVPEGYKAPWLGMSPKNQENQRTIELKNAEKRIDAIRNIITQGQDRISKMERFIDLNQKVPTGEIEDIIGIENPLMRSPEIVEMATITKDIGPKMKVAGAGSTSDKDIELYLNSTVNIKKPLSVNWNTLTDYQKQLDKTQAKADFLEKYVSEFGHLRGADAAWKQNQDSYLKQMFGDKGRSRLYWEEVQQQKQGNDPSQLSEDLQLINQYLNPQK